MFAINKRAALAALLDTLGLNHLKRVLDVRSRGLILNYHRIGDPNETVLDRDIISATPENFRRQMAFLRDNFDVVSLDRLLDHEFECAHPGTAIAITFDDGYADNARTATPVLADYELRATFFVTTGFLDTQRLAWWDELAFYVRHATVDELTPFGFEESFSVRGEDRKHAIRRVIECYKKLPGSRADLFLSAVADAAQCEQSPEAVVGNMWMTWDDARAIEAAGMTIGAHTVTHPVLANLSIAQQRFEVFESRDRIATELGHRPRFFSYPVGQPDSFTGETEQIIAEAGFDAAFSFYGGAVDVGSCSRFNVPRIAIERYHSGALFRARTTWPTTVFANC